jgi:hypothetical protein
MNENSIELSLLLEDGRGEELVLRESPLEQLSRHDKLREPGARGWLQVILWNERKS